MKRIAAATLAISLLAGAVAAEVKWADGTFDEILARAQAENKYILVDFYTIWCSPCKKMDKETYANADVEDFIESTAIAVKRDSEAGEGVELSKEHKVIFWPTTILFGPDGEEVDRYIGFVPPDEFIEIFDGYTKGVGTIEDYQARVAQDPDNVELALTLAQKLADAARSEEAAAAAERAMKLDPDDKLGRRSNLVFTLGEAFYADAKYAEAKPYYETVINGYPKSEDYLDALSRLARVYHKLGDSDAAVATYEKTLVGREDNPSALNGFAWFCGTRGIGLDKALAVAQKAVELSNHDPGILDTLAEVHYARGEFDDAIKVIQEAMERDTEGTNTEYFDRQIEKFKKAKEEAESRASAE